MLLKRICVIFNAYVEFTRQIKKRFSVSKCSAGRYSITQQHCVGTAVSVVAGNMGCIPENAGAACRVSAGRKSTYEWSRSTLPDIPGIRILFLGQCTSWRHSPVCNVRQRLLRASAYPQGKEAHRWDGWNIEVCKLENRHAEKQVRQVRPRVRP